MIPVLNPFRFLREFFRVIGALSLVISLLLAEFFALACVLYLAERTQALPGTPQGFAESLYFSAVTGLTIGYGDLVPHTVLGRSISLLLALHGIVLTGIVAAAAVKALEMQIERRGRAGG
jgi:voltage-gated potassium channel